MNASTHLHRLCGLGSILALALACQDPKDDGQPNMQQDEASESGDPQPTGSCADQDNEADCEAISDPEDVACAWVVGSEVEVVGDQCQLGAEVGVCVKTSQGDSTCGAYSGLYVMESEGVVVVINTSSCDGVPGFTPCDMFDGPPELPAACSCDL